MTARSLSLALASILCLWMPNGVALGQAVGKSGLCNAAISLVRERVYKEWGGGTGMAIEAEGDCRTDEDGLIRTVWWSYSTVISRHNNNPHVEFVAEVKLVEADNSYILCGWRNPSDTPYEEIAEC